MSATPYSGDEAYAFVSFPREDRELVQEELDRLHELGVRIDFPEDDEPVAPARLQGASFYLVLVSDSTDDDAHLRKEVSAAIQEGKDGLCIHVFDVPLDGPIKLLLKSLPQVSRPSKDDPEFKHQAYLRRIVQALPDEVKSRPIELPGDERPAAPPPPRSRDDLGGGVAGLGNAALGGIAAGVGLLILLIVYIALPSSDSNPSPTPTPEASEPSDGPSNRRRRPLLTESPLIPTPGAKAASALQSGLSTAKAALEKDAPQEAVDALAALDSPDLAKDASARIEGHLLRARAYDRLGKPDEAAKDYDQVIAQRPADAALRSARAEARKSMGDVDGALEDLGKLLELSPKDDFAWAARGDYLLEQKRYAEAIADYSQAIELQPRSRSAYLKRSRARELSGDAAGAAADKEAAYTR